MNLIEEIRSGVLRDTFRQPVGLASLVAEALTEFDFRDRPSRWVSQLGSSLNALFAKRQKIPTSSMQPLWRDLVLWYLNLCYAGTHAVAVTKRFVLPCVRDALSINYDNRSVKSDMDIVVLACPALLDPVPGVLGEKAMLARADALLGESFGKSAVVNVQAKTHWNDSAQTPMLWNVIYRQARLRQIVENGFGVGRGMWSIANLGDFGYAFVCAPSNREALNYEPHRVAVLRVRGMTAGAYWGHPTRNGVAASIGEFFIRQFQRRGNIWPNVADLGRGYSTAAAGSPATPYRDLPAFHLHGADT